MFLSLLVDLQLSDLIGRLADKNIVLRFDKKAKDLLAKIGFDPENGARPLRRAIQNMIESPLAEGILEGKFKENGAVSISCKNDEFDFKSA